MDISGQPETLPPLPSIKRPRHTDKEFKRAHQACLPCRARKARCDLGADTSPPCARCRREHRECIFSTDRNHQSPKRQRNANNDRRSSISRPEKLQVPIEAVNGQKRASVVDEDNSRLATGENSGVIAPRTNLTDSVIRTVVSNGNDALNILFEAAAHQQGLADKARFPNPSPSGPAPAHETSGSALSPHPSAPVSGAVKLSQPTHETLKVWRQSRFVMTGWLSAEEAVTLIDLFFENMCPLSPVVTDYYRNHGHHFQLITQEPLLTTTILMISSRYHLLPGIGAASRGFYMHEKFWQYCQHLIQRILYGQEKSSKAKTRTIGSIEALLLISEWHPRALHFPAETEGWHTSLYMSADGRGSDDVAVPPVSSTSTKWLEDVIEPAKRSDRMSWMLLGTALTLAHELGVFDDDEEPIFDASAELDLNKFQVRKLRMRKLLYVYVNQLASRLGCSTMFPQNSGQATMITTSTPNDKWQSHMSSWIELTKLVKSASELFFPSPSVTRQLLNSGRYSSLLDHFVPLLEQWRRKHLDSHNFQGPYQDTLFIEYHYARIYINSIGVEAVCQRAVAEMDSALDGGPLRTMFDGQENDCINEVIDGGTQILERTIKLAESDTLRFSPVRTFLLITTSSVFLLKAISLRIRNAKLQSALDTLDRSIQAMRLSHLDDMHLAARYATLLETHVARLRQGFVVSSQKQSRFSRTGTRRVSPFEVRPLQANGTSFVEGTPATTTVDSPANGQDLPILRELSADDWLSLPFDPSMAPIGADKTFGFSALDGNALDFIWNLPGE